MAFDEPVGVFVPDSRVKDFDGFGEAVFGEILFEHGATTVEFATDPIFAGVVGGVVGENVGVTLGFGFFVNETLGEARDVPELVTEVAAGDNGVFGESI